MLSADTGNSATRWHLPALNYRLGSQPTNHTMRGAGHTPNLETDLTRECERLGDTTHQHWAIQSPPITGSGCYLLHLAYMFSLHVEEGVGYLVSPQMNNDRLILNCGFSNKLHASRLDMPTLPHLRLTIAIGCASGQIDIISLQKGNQHVKGYH